MRLRALWIGASAAVAFALSLSTAVAQQNIVTPICNGSPCGTASNPMAVTNSSTTALQQISTTSIAANLVVKATPGNLASFDVAADSTLSGAAWWVMIYNAAAAPADGAVTPAKCYALPTGTTSFTGAFPEPAVFATGIVIGVSTNGCFTKAASAHAFIAADFQ